MAYWNHFAEDTRTKIMFKDLAINDKFRVGKWRGKRRSLVIAIKTGEKTYIEERSKKETSLYLVDNYEVYALLEPDVVIERKKTQTKKVSVTRSR